MSKKENLSTTSTGSEKGTAERRKYFSSQWVVPMEDFFDIKGNLWYASRYLEEGKLERVKKCIDKMMKLAEELWQAKYTAIEVMNARMNQLEDKNQKALDFYIKAASPKTDLKSMSGEDLLKMYEDVMDSI